MNWNLVLFHGLFLYTITFYLKLFKLVIGLPLIFHNVQPFSISFFLHTSSRQRMIMDFRLWKGRLYDFSSIYKKVMKFFIHPHEGYEVNFKFLNIRLCLEISSSRTSSPYCLLNTLCTNLYSIILNLIKFRIGFEFHSMFWIWNWVQFHSICMWWHSIFSLKYNLTFTSSTHLFWSIHCHS
jgi:hypothetical protein